MWFSYEGYRHRKNENQIVFRCRNKAAERRCPLYLYKGNSFRIIQSIILILFKLLLLHFPEVVVNLTTGLLRWLHPYDRWLGRISTHITKMSLEKFQSMNCNPTSKVYSKLPPRFSHQQSVQSPHIWKFFIDFECLSSYSCWIPENFRAFCLFSSKKVRKLIDQFFDQFKDDNLCYLFLETSKRENNFQAQTK